MTTFVLDYSGTLNRLADPFGFVADLRRTYPGCRVVLFTGSVESDIERAHPGLLEVFDRVLWKPCRIDEALDPMTSRLVFVDDEPMMRAMAVRCSKRTPSILWSILEPEALLGLVPG